MLVLISMLVAIVVWVLATVMFGYAGLIIGALVGVAAMYLFIIGLTASGLFAKRDAAH